MQKGLPTIDAREQISRMMAYGDKDGREEEEDTAMIRPFRYEITVNNTEELVEEKRQEEGMCLR